MSPEGRSHTDHTLCADHTAYAEYTHPTVYAD